MRYLYLILIIITNASCSHVKQSDKALLKHLQNFNPEGIKKELSRDIHPGQEGEFFLTFSFFEACSNGDLNRVKELLEAGSNIHSVTALGKTALHLACESKRSSTELVKFLINHGLDINGNFKTHLKIEKFCWSPLMIACVHRNVDIARVLIEKGAMIDEKDAGGDTPLLKASFYGSVKIVEELLKNGANIKAINNEGNTALHEAFLGYMTKNTLFSSSKDSYTEEDFEEIMNLLNHYGIDFYARNNQGKTIQDLIQDFKTNVAQTGALNPEA